ncbi:NeuD/PglB/VioB family sugar acetyltransferase [Chloroflexota bacterium]
MAETITIPLLNPNEPEAVLAALHITEGQQVAQGDLLCTLETTKSTAEVEAPGSGYVAGLRFEEGANVQAGELLCYLAESPDWRPPKAESASDSTATAGSGEALPPGLRITQPALALAQMSGLDLGILPLDRLVTEKVVQQALGAEAPVLGALQGAFDASAILIYGGGGHGKALIDLVRSLGTYQIVGLLDDGIAPGETIMGLPLLGGGEVLAQLYKQGVRLAINAVGGIGNLAVRVKVFKRLADFGFACPAVVHPTAFVEASAGLSPGVQVFPHAYVGSEAHVDYGCIVNSGAIVSHDCKLGEYVNISPGAILAGEVHIGAGALVGMGATVNLRVNVGAGARIGNGGTVKKDVPEKGLVQAGTIWPAR